MAKYQLIIDIDEDEEGDADYAYGEIVGAIEDARDSDELGGCGVTWGDLERISPP